MALHPVLMRHMWAACGRIEQPRSRQPTSCKHGGEPGPLLRGGDRSRQKAASASSASLLALQARGWLMGFVRDSRGDQNVGGGLQPAGRGPTCSLARMSPEASNRSAQICSVVSSSNMLAAAASKAASGGLSAVLPMGGSSQPQTSATGAGKSDPKFWRLLREGARPRLEGTATATSRRKKNTARWFQEGMHCICIASASCAISWGLCGNSLHPKAPACRIASIEHAAAAGGRCS